MDPELAHDTSRPSIRKSTLHVDSYKLRMFEQCCIEMPKRIQMRRTKDWRKPEGVVYVGRPSRWGNPFSVQELGRAEAMRRFRELFERTAHRKKFRYPLADIAILRGKDLGCWCRPDEACHADILIEFANRLSSNCPNLNRRNVDFSEH